MPAVSAGIFLCNIQAVAAKPTAEIFCGFFVPKFDLAVTFLEWQILRSPRPLFVSFAAPWRRQPLLALQPV